MPTILIADDDENNRLLLRSVLQFAGHEVHEAARGEEALKLAEEVRPDLLIVDLHMPGMDGTQLIKALRAGPATSALRIALYTGTMMTDAMEDFIELFGIRGVIPKPSEPEELIGLVAQALNGD